MEIRFPVVEPSMFGLWDLLSVLRAALFGGCQPEAEVTGGSQCQLGDYEG